MKSTILAALLICLFVAAKGQKTKAVPVQTVTKSFVVSEATKKDLPAGVTLVSNKLVLSKGFSFIKTNNSNAQLLINSKGKAVAQFSCTCSNNGGDGCILKSEDGFTCIGGGCCELIGSPYTVVASQMDVKNKD
jgi:hypothetical protein